MKQVLKPSCLVLTFVMLASSAADAQKSEVIKRKFPTKMRLTGIWQANDGGTYQIRQEGAKVWWYGRGPNNGRDWQNVFYGMLTNNQLTGEWADLPAGGAQSSGTLQLQIQPGHLTKILDTGGFGGSEWSPGAATTGGGASIGNLGAALSTINTSSSLPEHFRVGQSGKADGAVEFPVPGDVVAWFDQSAPMLENLLRRLAGDEAVRQYLAWEDQRHPTNLQRVDLRLKAINKLVQ